MDMTPDTGFTHKKHKFWIQHDMIRSLPILKYLGILAESWSRGPSTDVPMLSAFSLEHRNASMSYCLGVLVHKSRVHHQVRLNVQNKLTVKKLAKKPNQEEL